MTDNKAPDSLTPLRIGFIPLVDAAPVAIASSLGHVKVPIVAPFNLGPTRRLRVRHPSLPSISIRGR